LKKCDILWHFVTFPNVTMSHFWTLTFLGLCHTVCIFFSFFSKTKNVHKTSFHGQKFSYLFSHLRGLPLGAPLGRRSAWLWSDPVGKRRLRGWRPSACRAPRNMPNVTNPQPPQGSFQTFRKYLRLELWSYVLLLFDLDKSRILALATFTF